MATMYANEGLENYSPTEVAKAPPYYSLNPGLFDSVEHWKYRDLQRLAKTLGLSGGGRRQDVVDRLLSYHREQRGSGQAGMFHSVEVKANDCGAAINPVLLSPLRPERMKSDERSAMSASRLAAANAESSPRYRSCAAEGACAPATPKRTPARSPLTPRGNGTVLFSPFNMVKLIPAKEHSEMFGQYREPSWEVDDDEDDDELSDDDDGASP